MFFVYLESTRLKAPSFFADLLGELTTTINTADDV